MNSAQFKKAGHEMIDFAINYMETLNKRDPLPHVTPGWLQTIMPYEAPVKGEPWANVLQDIEKVALDGMAHWQHHQFFAYFPAGNSWPSILGDILSNATGANGTTWDSCPVVTELEIIVLDWACKFLNLPKFFLSHFSNPESVGGGVIQTSASDAILLSLVAAREDCVHSLRIKFPKKPRAVLLNTMVAYCSNQCHSCVEKGGMIGEMRLRQLPADELGGVRGQTLRDAIKEDLENGLVPYFYCGILGSTGVCAFDDLMEVGPVCEEYGMWMHVDAAYAGSSFVCPEMRYLMQGLEYAWSMNINCNKWMLTNFDASLHWIRYREKVVNCLTGYDPDVMSTPEYPIINLKHFGLPATRRFRAIKLWFVMRTYGVSGLQKYVRNHVYLARLFERYVQRDARFEVVGAVKVGLTCFRLKGTNEVNKVYLDALNTSRKIHMVPSAFHDKFVIRFALSSEFANEKDVDEAWRICSEYATVLLHVYETEHSGEAILAQLFDKQHTTDNFNLEHPDEVRAKEEQEALVLIQKGKSKSEETVITDQVDNVAVDGSWSTSSTIKIQQYDDYMNLHPEMYQDQDNPNVEVEKVPSMLRATHLDEIEQNTTTSGRTSVDPGQT